MLITTSLSNTIELILNGTLPSNQLIVEIFVVDSTKYFLLFVAPH